MPVARPAAKVTRLSPNPEPRIDARARHGDEISELIESRSNGTLKFHIASLYPLLYRLEERGWLGGR